MSATINGSPWQRRRAPGTMRNPEMLAEAPAGAPAEARQPPNAAGGAAPAPPAAVKPSVHQLLAGSQLPAPLPKAKRTTAGRQPAPRKQAAGSKRKEPPTSPAQEQQAQQEEGQKAPPSHELWAETHAPKSESALVVHRKKVEEVRQWLEQQLTTAGQAPAAAQAVQGTGLPPPASRVLLVSGPPGCGKSATVAAVAAAVGFEVTEWRAPTPTLWDEVQYQYQGAVKYASKLADFDEFVLRAKLPALALSRTPPLEVDVEPAAAGTAAVTETEGQPTKPAGQRPKLVLLEDLPHAAGPEQRQRLAASLRDLAAAARFPVVLCVTEVSSSSAQERSAPSGLPRELAAALEGARATTITFNPLTTPYIVKALRAVLAAEGRQLPEHQLAAIAEQAGGDLRNALGTLQFACIGAAPAAPPPVKPKRRRGKAAAETSAGPSAKGKAGSKAAAAVEGDQGGAAPGVVGAMQRDASLSLMHSLGKLLYNKRLPLDLGSGSGPNTTTAHSAAAAPSSGSPPFAAWTQRGAMDAFSPEGVVAAAGLEASSVAAFLHENLPNFVEDGAVQDLAGCLEALSTADVLSSGVRWGGGEGMLVGDDVPAAPLADAAAASVATRGVCFWNAHPAPRRWLPLRAPVAYTAQRGVAANRKELALAAGAGRVAYGGSGSLESAAMVAAEVLPYLRCVAQGAPHDGSLLMQQPASWTRFWSNQLHATRLHGGVGPEAVVEGGRQWEQDPIQDSDDG